MQRKSREIAIPVWFVSLVRHSGSVGDRFLLGPPEKCVRELESPLPQVSLLTALTAVNDRTPIIVSMGLLLCTIERRRNGTGTVADSGSALKFVAKQTVGDPVAQAIVSPTCAQARNTLSVWTSLAIALPLARTGSMINP